MAVFGATGVVGYCTAVIAAEQGARVTIVGHDGIERVQEIAASIKQRFGVTVEPADGSTEAKKAAIVEGTEVVLAAAKAGIQVISQDAARLCGRASRRR